MTSGSARCRHVGDCGGCSQQELPYAQQLAEKEARVRAAVAPFEPAEFLPIQPSPDIFYYRNKMEFVFQTDSAGELRLGLRRPGRFDQVVNLEECLLFSQDVGALLGAVRRWGREENLHAYNLRSHRGFLRYLVVREGKNTGQRLLTLVTAPGDLPRDSFQAAVASSGWRPDALLWQVNDSRSDLARGRTAARLTERESITESLNGQSFELSSTTFFQTNSKGAEVLYQTVGDFLGKEASLSTLFDLYCGVGTIGLSCARRAQKVIGLETNAASVEDARRNAQSLGVGHAEFFAADVAQLAQRPDWQALWGEDGAAAVIDPPRPGLGKKVRRFLVEHPLARWVYVSCNPRALQEDLPVLMDAYRVERVRCVDLFPHTAHVETVLLLERRA